MGKLNNSKLNSNYYDIIDSPSSKEKDCNLIMIPKLIINKNNKKIINSKNEINKKFKEDIDKLNNELKRMDNLRIEDKNKINELYNNVEKLKKENQELLEKNKSIQEIIILLYGFIGQIYKNNLLDPIDHPISLINSINRIISHIRNIKMKTNEYTLLKSCIII